MSDKRLKICECCGSQFKPVHRNHKYCTSKCLTSMSHSKAKPITREQVNEWVSVEDRLPECEKDVVLYPDFSGEPVVGFLVSGDAIFVDNDDRKVTPTHWMPLPPAPSE